MLGQNEEREFEALVLPQTPTSSSVNEERLECSVPDDEEVGVEGFFVVVDVEVVVVVGVNVDVVVKRPIRSSTTVLHALVKMERAVVTWIVTQLVER